MKWMRRSIVALLVAGALSLSLVGSEAAQQEQDGLVNIYVGDDLVEACVLIAVAANVVVELCDLDVFLAVLGQIRSVDASGRDREFCTVDEGPLTGPVTVTQNDTCPE